MIKAGGGVGGQVRRGFHSYHGTLGEVLDQFKPWFICKVFSFNHQVGRVQ